MAFCSRPSGLHWNRWSVWCWHRCESGWLTSLRRHAGEIFTGDKLKDETSLPDTQDFAYGPQSARQLGAGKAKDSEGHPLAAKNAILNADSYAWFVVVSRVKIFPVFFGPSTKGHALYRSMIAWRVTDLYVNCS